MNKKLIQQVQEGTGCIDNSKNEVLDKLKAALAECFPDEIKVIGLMQGRWRFYFKSDEIPHDYECSDTLPTGLTPIPLDDFFEEEEETEETYYPGTEFQRLFNAIDSVNGTPLVGEMQNIISIVHEDFPTPEQPALPEEVGKTKDDILLRWLGELMAEKDATHDWIEQDNLIEKINALNILLGFKPTGKPFFDKFREIGNP